MTTARIHVCITGESETNPALAFYPIEPQQADTWARQHMQVGYVYREDNKKTEVHVVIPGCAWIISEIIDIATYLVAHKVYLHIFLVDLRLNLISLYCTIHMPDVFFG